MVSARRDLSPPKTPDGEAATLALYLQTRAELHELSTAYSQLEKEHQVLNAEHQDLFFNSTPSVIVQDLQQHVNDLTAEIDRRYEEYGQMRKDKLFLSDQVQEMRTQNTHLTQEVSGLKTKVAELEVNLGIWKEVDNKACDQECASAQKGLRVRLPGPSFQQPGRFLPAEEATAAKAAKDIWHFGSADEQVHVDKSVDEDSDDYKSVPCGTPLGSPAHAAPSALEGTPLDLATLIDEVDGLTQACEDVQHALKVKLTTSTAFTRTGRSSPADDNVTGRPAKGVWHFGAPVDKVEVADNVDQLDCAISPQKESIDTLSLNAIMPSVMTGRTSSASLDFAFSPSPAIPYRADFATPAKSLISRQAMSKSSPADTLSPLDFTGMPFSTEGLTEFGSAATFAGADMISPARTPSSARSRLTIRSLASSPGRKSALAFITLPVSPQDLPQGGFGSPVEITSEGPSPNTPASPDVWYQMRSLALFPGVDAAPLFSCSSPAVEFATPASVPAAAQVLSGPTPATHQTWTSPCGWGSTPGSLPDSPALFGYLVTPPITPHAQPLSEAATPSLDQQLHGSSRQGIQDSRSSARSISLCGLSKMRTGFGAETLYRPGGMLSEFDTASPRPPALPTAPTVGSSQAAAGTNPIAVVHITIARQGYDTADTRGPMQGALQECLQDWCASTELQLDSLLVSHNGAAVPQEMWQHSFEQLAWGSEVRLDVAVATGSGSAVSASVARSQQHQQAEHEGSPAQPSLRQAGATAPSIKSMLQMRTGFGVELLYAPGGMLADLNGCEHAQASPQDDAAPTCSTLASLQPQLPSTCTPACSKDGKRLSAVLQQSPAIRLPALPHSPKSNTPRFGSSSQTALAGVRTPLAELNLAGSAVSNRADFSKSPLYKASSGVSAGNSFSRSPVSKQEFAGSAVRHRSSSGRSPLVGVPASADVTSHRSSCSTPGASPSTPTRVDLLTPAGPSGSRHSFLSAGDPSPRVSVYPARLQVPSMLTANSSSSPSSTGVRSTRSHATSAASDGRRSTSTASLTPGHLSKQADDNAEGASAAAAAVTVAPEAKSAQAVRAAGKARQTRGSTSRPAWSSAYTCIAALHPSPAHSIPHSRQVVTPGPSPTASAGRSPDAASHAAGPSSVQSHQAMARLGPGSSGSTVAATVLSTIKTRPVSRVGTSSRAAASGSASTAQPSTRRSTRATAAAAARQKASVKPSTSTAQPSIRQATRASAAAAAGQEASVRSSAAVATGGAAPKAPAVSSAAEPETLAPRRSARLSKLPSRPSTTAGQPRAAAVARNATAARPQGASGTDIARPARASTAAARTSALRAAGPAAARPTGAAAGGMTVTSSKPAVAASLTRKILAKSARHSTKHSHDWSQLSMAVAW